MSGSMKSCCVPKCGKTRADNVILHSFPDPGQDRERFTTWVNAVGSSIADLDQWFIFKNRKICHDHFEQKYLTWTRRLSYGAIPTINMPGLQSKRLVMSDITNAGAASSAPEAVTAATSAVTQEDHAVEDLTNINVDTTSLKPSDASTSADVTTCQSDLPTKIQHETSVPMNADNVKQTLKRKRKESQFKDDGRVLAEMLKKMTKKKENYATRLKKAMNLAENTTFQNIMKKFTTLAAIFIALQFREIKHKKMGRKFTDEEKVMALSIYKHGPKCYKLLRKFFVLPSHLTLSRMIARANLRAGINDKLFKVIKKKIKNMKADDKLCILLFDEVAINPHFDYNSRKDIISGFVTNGKTRQNAIADHALVFMIRGISRNYKQPIGYTFCSGSTKKEELATLITEVIRKIHSVGLRVLATVCDQGASNVSSINHLIAETRAKYLRKGEEHRRDTFEVDDSEVIPLFDPPHLIKGIRNNLLEKDLKCTIDGETKIAKWDHIVKLHQEDPSYAGVRLVDNLTADHVNPEKCKMRVKMATQVFSSRVASTMGYLAGHHILPLECQQTADILLFFDKLFDSVNGSQENYKKRSGKPLLGALTPTSEHNQEWKKAKIILSTMKFVKNGRDTKVPSVNNWLRTINNLEYLRDTLFEKYQIRSVWLRHFNQDPLENFFGTIRSHGCRNTNPSPEGFEIAFASLLITNLTGTHSPGSNCEEDSCSTMFTSMRTLFKVSEKNNVSQVDLSYMQQEIFVDFEIKKNDVRILAQLEYIAGYLLKQSKKKLFGNCVTCTQNLYDHSRDSNYLIAREYNKCRRSLQYANENILKMYSQMQDIMMWVLKNHSSISNIKNFAKTIFYIEIDYNFITCEAHKKRLVEFIFNLTCRFYIYTWCKNINNILIGRSKEVNNDIMKNLALKYMQKRKKNK